MRVFRRCLLTAMRGRWITIPVTLALFAVALWGIRFIPEQFFPSSDRPELLVNLSLQDNASVLATRDDVAAEFDKMLAADRDIERFSTYVGQGAIRFYLPIDVALPNDYFAQSVVVTKGLKERDQVRARLEQALATRFPGVVARIYPLELGPPVGWPVKYRVSGPDFRACTRSRWRLPTSWGRSRECATSTSTGRAGTVSGSKSTRPGAPARSQFAGSGVGAK